MATVKLETEDKQVFTVPIDVAQKSMTIKGVLEGVLPRRSLSR